MVGGPENFVGRHWLFREIADHLSSDLPTNRGVIIAGSPGSGKTGIILKLVKHSCFGRGESMYQGTIPQTDWEYSGQSYKQFTLVIYDSRVVNYDRRGFIRLATGEATDQLICCHLICFPNDPRLLGLGRFKPCLGYFLLKSSDCMMETCMLLARMRVHEHW